MNNEFIAKCKEDLAATNKHLRDVHDKFEQDYYKLIERLCLKEKALHDRLEVLSNDMNDAAEKYGNNNSSGDDMLEINAGGKIIVTKRSILTNNYTTGTTFGALFSGRWDKKLQRDSNGRIFLDVNSECFQTILTYLNELENIPCTTPALPSVNDEYLHVLWQQLQLFDLWGKVVTPRVITPNSSIIPQNYEGGIRNRLQICLEKENLFGYFSLIFRGTRDGLISPDQFFKRCNKKGSFIFILQTAEFSESKRVHPSKPRWSQHTTSVRVGKLSNVEKMLFGTVLRMPHTSYISELSAYEVLLQDGTDHREVPTWSIKNLEVFEIFGTPPLETKKPNKLKPITRFQHDINQAFNAKRDCLPQTELEIHDFENSFRQEQNFIDQFISGSAHDVITLNVRGTIMATKRSTLLAVEESVLAQQFDDTKWTEHGYNSLRVKRWSVDDVCAWVNNIEGIQEDAGSIFRTNGITGCELLALTIDGLKMMGIERAGTLCLIQKEIEVLVKSTQNVVSLIDHCPYCFGKILDFLRLKQLRAQGLAKEEPALSDVEESHRKMFEKVVNFYFPGDAAKLILGG